jgi:thioredoxin-dependent peroxiredoxin
MLQVGEPVPSMTLQDDQGNQVDLHKVGGPYILYVYPADDTPGCTKQACAFRDSYADYRKAGIQIFGVSPDTVESHVMFRDKYSLPFPLLADPDHKLADALGAWGQKQYMGKTYDGILRTTFVVGQDGKIQNVYPDVKPEDNASEILRDLGVERSREV